MRVRNKSTTTAMLGMDLAAMGQGQPQQEQKPQEKSSMKKLLKGLLGN